MQFNIIRVFRDSAESISQEIHQIDSELGNTRLMPSLACQKMLILAEDKRAWKHCGVDFVAILRSIVLTVLGKPHGGSTILQQLVRTLTGRYERTFARKYSEILLSYMVAAKVDRSIYPRVYLSIAYYGTGIENYDKLIDQIRNSPEDELQFAAMAVARLKYPEPRQKSPLMQTLILRREKFLIRKYRMSKDTRIFSHVKAV